MAIGNGNGVQVPVSLQLTNLLNIIHELESKLGNLKVGSKGFKEILNVISSIYREIDKLQIQTSKPFINLSLFNTAERSVGKLEDELERVQITLGRISFNDLLLTPAQTRELQNFNTEIQNIKKSIKEVKETAKLEFLSSDGGLAWLGFSEKNAIAANQSLAQLTTAINSEYKKLADAVDKAKDKLEEYKNAMNLSGKINQFLNKLANTAEVKDLSNVLGDMYKKIFTAPGNAFKTGGKTILADWLSLQFELDEETIRQLVNLTAEKVFNSLKNGELSLLITNKLGTLSSKTTSTSKNELEADLANKKARLEELKPALDGITNANKNISVSEENLNQRLKAVNIALDEFKEKAAAAARGNTEVVKTCSNANVQLLNFRTQLTLSNTAFLLMERRVRNLNAIKMTITNFMGFTQVLNLTKTAIRNALNHIKELDSVMNKISIVTNMTTSDLWNQVSAYSDMALKYGVSIKGAYEISLIYYQQGLQTADVLTLTNETLKLAKISGLDYAKTTDYMTTALRGFKMEMSEASTIVDVYSNLAAHTAVTQEELAVAMSKTASSLESVGASFEESSAMIATMVAVTRESATNIGSALKSIAARYGEMKSDPLKLVDSEGDELSYNKVDAALQSVGITLKTTDGQFRNFTDVIIELSEKWDQLESTQQRYIATLFAGNRQQSRFLALVSNADLLKSNLGYAENSEDTGTLQALKTLDSIESKIELVKVAYQLLYTTVGVEDLWKGLLESTKNVMNTMNSLPKLFGKLPIGAIALAADFVKVIKDIGFTLLGGVTGLWNKLLPEDMPDKMAVLAERIAEIFSDTLAKKIDEKNPGGKLANQVAELAANAGKDLNQESGKERTVETAAKPAVEVTETSVEKAQLIAAATLEGANATAQMADNLEKAATAFLTDTSVGVNFSDTSSIDGWIQEIEDKKEVLVKDFSQVPTNIIESIVRGLIAGQGIVGDAAEQLVSLIVPRIQEKLNMHSPSPTIIAMFEDGVGKAIAMGLEMSIDSVIKAAEKLGIAVPEALKLALDKEGRITLNDYFDLDTSKLLFKDAGVIDLDRLSARLKEARAYKEHVFNSVYSTSDQQAYAKRALGLALNALNTNRNTLYGLDFLKYAGIPADRLTATHNFPIQHLEKIFGWGEFPGISYAVRAKDDRILSDYGDSMIWLPRDIADPKKGRSFLYNGDAHTPSISGNPINISDVYRDLNALPATLRDLLPILEFIRDATRIFSIPLMQALLSKAVLNPIIGSYRTTLAYDPNILNELDKALKSMTTYYLSRSVLHDKGYKIDKPLEQGGYTGYDALKQAIYKTVNLISEREGLGRPYSEEAQTSLLSNNLFSFFASKAGIHDPNKFAGEDAEGVIEQIFDMIKFLKQEPGNDMMEGKLLGGAKFNELPALLYPSIIDKNVLALGYQKNVNPLRTFLYDEGSPKEAPLGKDAMARYINNYVPGTTFGEKPEPWVDLTLDDIVNIDLIQELLRAKNLPPVEIDALLDLTKSLLNTDIGLTIAASLRGAMSNIDLSAEDSSALVQQVLDFYGKLIESVMPELTTKGQFTGSMIAQGLTMGLTLGSLTAIAAAREAGQQTIDSLNLGAGVSSPSVFAIISGKFIMLGLEEGIDEGTLAALNAAEKAGTAIVGKIDSSLALTPMGLEMLKQNLIEALNKLDLSEEAKNVILKVVDGLTEADISLKPTNKNIADELLGDPLVKMLSSTPSVGARDRDAFVGLIAAGTPAPVKMASWSELAAAASELASIIPPVDNTEVLSLLQAVIDKLVEMGTLGEEDGAKIKAAFENATPELITAKIKELGNALNATGNAGQEMGNKMSKLSLGTLGSAIRMLASLTGLSLLAKGAFTLLGGAITLVGTAISIFDKKSKAAAASNPWMAIAMGVMALWNGLSMIIETPEEKLERLTKEAEELNNKAKQLKSDSKELNTTKKKIEELELKRYDSAEATEEYLAAVDNLAAKFPELIASFDDSGNAILDEINMTEVLTKTRKKSAEAALEAALAELKRSKLALEVDLKNSKGFEVHDYKSTDLGYNILQNTILSTKENNAFKWLQQDYNAIRRDYNWDEKRTVISNGLSGNVPAAFAVDSILLDMLTANLDNIENLNNKNLWTLLLTVYNANSNETYFDKLSALLGFLQDRANKLANVGSKLSDEESLLLELFDSLLLNEEDASLIESYLSDFNEKVVAYNQALEQYKGDLSAENLEAIREALGLLTATMGEMRDSGYALLKNYILSYSELLGRIGIDINKFFEDETAIKAASREIINSTIRSRYTNKSFITEESGLTSIITERLYSMTEGVDDIDTWLLAHTQDMEEMVAEADNLWTLATDRYDTNNELVSANLTKMLNAPGRYTFKDINSYLESTGIILENGLKDYLEKRSKINSETIKKAISDNIDTLQKGRLSSYLSNLKLFINERELDFTNYDRNYFNTIADQINTLEKLGLNSYKFYELATNLYRNIYSDIDDATRYILMDAISKNGLKTEEGIQKVIDAATSNGVSSDSELITSLTSLQELVGTNILLAIDAAKEEFISGWGDSSKELKKLTSGIDFTDMLGMIDLASLFENFTLTKADFSENGDKLVLTAEKANDYWTAYLNYMLKKSNMWAQKIEVATKSLSGLDDLETADVIFTEDNVSNLRNNISNNIELLRLLLGGNFDTYINTTIDKNGIEQYSWKEGIDIASVLNEAYKKVTDGILSYEELIDYAAAQIIKTSQWELGDYSSLEKYLVNGDTLESIVKDKTKLKDYVNKPDIKNAVKKIQEALSSFLSDAISKGVENLDLSDYEGLPDWIATEVKVIADPYELASKYADYIGGTLEDSNSLIISALNKKFEKTSADSIKDLNFISKSQFTVTESALESFVNTFNLDLKELLNTGVIFYNLALGEYVVNYLDTGLDLSQVEGFSDTVADSINSFFDSLVNLIKNGLSGALSHTDASTLTTWAKSLGIDKLSFDNTKDGLKLATDSALELYERLKAVNSIKARLVFDELNKSLQEANEHYKNISDIANRIAWIEDKNHPERAKQYALELALAKEIYAVRSTTEDSSFNFMSNDIPGAQKNPINYYENWAKAIKTVNDALKTKGTYKRQGKTVKSGFIDYQDWYNIVTEMNNIAKLGGDIKFAGETLDGSLEAASKLIEKGAASLVATDTGEIKVALLGMELDFSSGADAFADGVTDGILAMAQSQVKMLNGMIKLMETIVAMEKLSDIDAAKDGHLDLSDLFPDFTVDSKTDTAKLGNLEAFNKFVAVAGDSLETISINGENLKDMIKRAQTSGLNKSEAQNFTNIMDSLYLMYLSGDYNLSSIYESIRLIAEASGFEGTIQLGDSTVVFKAGKIITKIDKNTWVDAEGNKYSSEKEALQGAQKLLLQNAAKEADGNILLDLDNNEFTVTLEGSSVKFTINDSGDIVDNEGNTYSSLDSYLSEHYKTLMEEENYNIEELKIHLGLKVIPEIDAENGLTEDLIARLRAAKIKSFDDLQKAWEEDQSTGHVHFKAKYGISLGENEVNLTKELIQQINELLADKTETITMTVVNEEALAALKAVEEHLDALDGRHVTSYVDVKESNSTTTTTTPNIKKPSLPRNKNGISYLLEATGNVGLAKAKGTLLGELGPELVVSNGRYFVAGQNGAEMINLADDAIVFNHLQTKSLLEKGMSSGRGKAVTNEKNAISYAKGNINGGPAKASASAALAALKQLRAQWQALANLSVKDLAGKGGGGGGGGGDPKAFIKDLEKWYNWLQRIAVLEQKINYEEQLRSKYQSDMIAHGREYAQSQLDTLPYLKEQAAINKSLYESQLAYFEKRRAEMNDASNPFTSLYTFDEYGQLKYKDGALAKLSELSGRNSLTGQANYTAAEQYEKLVAMGYGKYMEYDSSGNKIDLKADDWQVNAVLAFWDKIDADQLEMLSLHDSVEEHKTAMLQAQLKLNEILKAIEDNLIAVEDKVLGAIVDMRERAIKLMQDERNAIEESANNLINGLSNQLLKERDMYSKQQDANELTKLQRQLGILQRSGGSASLIASLLKEITSKQLDAYFEAQQAQIDALQEASDNELERLDRLIELEEELLAYEKENGLLWNLVYEQMAKSPEEIATFIHLNTSSYWADSPIKSALDYRDTLFLAQEFVLYREKVEGGLDALIAANSDLAVAEQAANVTALGEAAAEASASAAGDLSSGSSGGSSEVTGTGTYKYKYINLTHHQTWEKMSDGSWKNLGKIPHTVKDGKCTRCGHAINFFEKLKETAVTGATKAINSIAEKIPGKASGGLVKKPTLSMLAENGEEAVLNAEQTAILKNDILSSKPTSLLSLLTDFRDAYNSIPSASAYSTINSGGVSIENAIVEMNVSKIANDYDAQRAGEQALDKMLLIARKTQAQNRIGR